MAALHDDPPTPAHALVASGAPSRGMTAALVGHGPRLVDLAVGVLATTSLPGAVGPEDPLAFISVALVLVVVGLRATYIPAPRAARIDPTVALRPE